MCVDLIRSSILSAAFIEKVCFNSPAGPAKLILSFYDQLQPTYAVDPGGTCAQWQMPIALPQSGPPHSWRLPTKFDVTHSVLSSKRAMQVTTRQISQNTEDKNGQR